MKLTAAYFPRRLIPAQRELYNFPSQCPFGGVSRWGGFLLSVKSRPLPEVEILNEFLKYDPETGILTCRKKFNPQIPVGATAGFKNSCGYLLVTFRNERLLGHRIIYKMMTGIDPQGMVIDHIDGCPLNNKISNLRATTQMRNSQNARISKRNKSGIKGVSWHKIRRRWIGHITYTIENGARKGWWKSFHTIEEATRSVREMREKIHGEFARHE